MHPLSLRIRLLLLALGVTSILGLLFWPEAEEPNWALNPNYVPDYARPVTVIASPAAAAPAVTAAAVADEDDAPPRSPTLSDQEFAERITGYGVVMNLREAGESETGSFYFVEPHDPLRSLPALGFIRASALLDSTARIEAYADSVPPARLQVAPTQVVQAALRERDDGCTLEIPVPVRRLDATDAMWTLALDRGAAQAVPASVWRESRNSAADQEEALRLAKRLPTDTMGREIEEAWSRDSALAKIPFQIKALHRFTLDDAEFIIADVRREDTKGDLLWDQRMFIAERDARDRSSPFRVVWDHFDLAYPDDLTTQAPVLLLRLGRERLLTLYTSGRYKDGGGGLFISRIDRAKWRVVASWTGGC